MLTKLSLGGNGATAKSTGSGSSGTTSKSLTMAIRTLPSFYHDFIQCLDRSSGPGRVEPKKKEFEIHSASYVVVASSSFPDL